MNINKKEEQQPKSILPLGLLDKCIGRQIWVLMRDQRELQGELCGFDDFFNMVLEKVTELDGDKKIELPTILLHGSQITLMVPGGGMQ